MMFALTVLRILLALSLVFVLCSAQKSFLKGHKKGMNLHEGKHESKDIHHYEKEYVPLPPEKEYIPVPYHEGPKYIPVYIVKECPKKSYDSYSPMAHHHHDHHHSYNYDNKLPEFKLPEFEGGYGGAVGGGEGGEEYDYASASKYRGTLDGYSETQYKPMRNKPNLTTGSNAKSETNDNNIGIVMSLHKETENRHLMNAFPN